MKSMVGTARPAMTAREKTDRVAGIGAPPSGTAARDEVGSSACGNRLWSVIIGSPVDAS